ncbi:conserved protein of unknown function [Candidatus Promineifilum breve]|uniref:Aminoglycoside phosphotransferase domain-containing protein n=1 Tax=Candidatus Promineifilum breve TaxID=1806508 RepID=A0A160T692_9CHLR|nr:phosphotransferase [Candidatus Promineifilum breve]CUS05911.1 conserved protein of unknown function [Candidatus Promineifilum breve]
MNLLTKQADPEWLSAVNEWVGEQLARRNIIATGPPAAVRVMPWSAVYRFPTGGGDVYFKACGPSQAHEPGLAAWLAAARPDCMIPVLAADTARGWLLLPDGGATLTPLINEPPGEVGHWSSVLTLQAGVQRDLLPRAAELLALGVLDRRTTLLPGLLAALLDRPDKLLLGEPEAITADGLTHLRALGPRFNDLCAELAAGGPPDTFVHDDFHEDHIFAARRPDGSWRYTFFDFGDACISHPFTQLVSQPRFAGHRFENVLDDTQKILREIYLSQWADFAPSATRQRALDLALIVGCVIRALTWVNACGDYLDEIPAELRAAYGSRLAFWLLQIGARVEALDAA